MNAARWLPAALVLTLPAFGAETGTRQAANYSSASIVNSASSLMGAYAPNTIIAIYGEGMSYDVSGISSADVKRGTLPSVMKGVRVVIGAQPAPLYYVSPKQINCLVPGNLLPGKVELQIVHDGRAGPAVRITLREAAPALFLLDAKTAIATRPDGTLIAKDAPAHPGEIVILYANGLGRTNPDLWFGEVAASAAKLVAFDRFNVFLNGTQVDHSRILYAGLAPGFAGLYQINLRLPDDTPADPEIRLAAGQEISPAEIYIRVQGP